MMMMMAFSETLHRMRDSCAAVVLLPLVLWATAIQPDEFPIVYDQPVIKVGPLDVVTENCSGNVPFSEEDFRLCLPPPPTFTLPPPPPFISGDCGATYSWQLVRNTIASSVDKDVDCKAPEKEERKKGRKVRGIPGPPGPPGPPGQPGAKGMDGLPGLVVFPDAAAMFGVSLEGLIAYRRDVKQLFVRDHLTWRPIRVAKCGDGIVDRDTGEQCDDANDDIHDDCLGCRRSSCGDGIRNIRTEECDGRDFGDKTCATYRDGMTGPLTCTPECQISYQRCRHKRYLRR